MKNKEQLYYACSEIDGLHFKIFTSHQGLRSIFINKKDASLKSFDAIKLHPDDPYLYNIFQQLEQYFNCVRKDFKVPFDLIGSDFQKNVWKELQKIPYGKTMSYKKIAEKVGGKTYVRAVGRANSQNPIPIVIPCHRVINTNGKLGGYSLGIDLKEKLLELEGSLSLELFG
ncbi:MAG: methylated-DNA--[protein]-cysteine S-methyltransferase [Ignavibacteriaceae bacterium]